jgi:hypothetical protein
MQFGVWTYYSPEGLLDSPLPTESFSAWIGPRCIESSKNTRSPIRDVVQLEPQQVDLFFRQRIFFTQ